MLAKIQMKESFDETIEVIRASMGEEHEGYYQGHHSRVLCPGFAMLADPRGAAAPEGWKVGAGFHANDEEFGWLRCYGSFLWLIESDPGNDYNATMILSGRRHSIKELFQMFFPEGWEEHIAGYKYIETWREDIPPWETTT